MKNTDILGTARTYAEALGRKVTPYEAIWMCKVSPAKIYNELRTNPELLHYIEYSRGHNVISDRSKLIARYAREGWRASDVSRYIKITRQGCYYLLNLYNSRSGENLKFGRGVSIPHVKTKILDYLAKLKDNSNVTYTEVAESLGYSADLVKYVVTEFMKDIIFKEE